jgi:hypothetical protein
MMHISKIHSCLMVAALAIGLAAAAPGAFGATIVINNNDGPGEGFNDPTPVSPVGGNPGTTLGAQRLYAFQYAADIWAQVLVSNVTIQVDAQMDPMYCTSSAAVLGGAGTTYIHRDWSSGNPPPLSGTWYPQALASAIAGIDLNPGTAEISATFNSDIDNNNSCLNNTDWYYGVDGNPPGGDIDFVTVVLHEICHGLGFATYQSSTGLWFSGYPDAYGVLMYREGATPPDYPSMTSGQRAAANISDPNLVWDGAYVNQTAATIPLTGGINNSRVRLYGPNPYQSGSSLSHWSTACTPNQLMEPYITGVDHTVVLDLQLLKDIGWTIVEPAACSVDPNSIDFGSVDFLSSKDSTFTIKNVGDGTLTGDVTESCTDFSIVSGGGGFSLAAGESVVVTVRFEPASTGLKNCTILTGTDCVNVSCTGLGVEPPPACLVDPDTLDFGSVDVGNFTQLSFDITNTGYGTLSGTLNESCPDFDIISGGSYSLTHNQSQTVQVIFFPGSAGLKECTIETGDDLCTDVYCSGTGAELPVCVVEPDTLDFGIVIVGDSLDLMFDVINAGGGVLSGSVSDTCSYYDVVAGAGAYVRPGGRRNTACDGTLQATGRRGVRVLGGNRHGGLFRCVLHRLRR